MKFVHVKYNFDPNSGYQINELLNIQRSRNDEIIVISTKDMTYFNKTYSENDDIEFMKKNGIKIIRLDYRFKIASRVWFKSINKVLNNIKPDIVYFHGIADFIDIQVLFKKKKYKIIRDCHMSWVASSRKFNRLFYKIYSKTIANRINKSDIYDKIFALGVEEYQYLKAIGISDEKIDYLYHGYNDDIMYYDSNMRTEIRKIYDISTDDIVISYIGKFDDFKRPDLIFDIIDKFDENFIREKKLKILFIGSKDLEFMKKFNEKKNKIEKKIKVIIDDAKPFNELRKYFSASDICIFPKETTLSSIHAQVCGCPVIMENYDSNKERVVLKENLYNIDNLEEANSILKNIICKDLYKKDVNLCIIDKLEKREYKKQIEKLYNW